MIYPVLVEYLQLVVLFSRDSIIRNYGIKAGFFYRQTPDLVMAESEKKYLLILSRFGVSVEKFKEYIDEILHS